MISSRCSSVLLNLALVILPSSLLASEPAQESREPQRAHLKVQFLFDGPIPERPKINGSKDRFCTEGEILSETLIVNEQRQIQNMVVYLDARRTDLELPDFSQRKPMSHVLESKNCRFVPHILNIMSGDTIVEKNSDKVGHNANFHWFNNPALGILIPTGSERKHIVRRAEPVPIPIECNIHPWMKAYVVVLDHPYSGVSNEQGTVEIRDLPVGKLTFRVWHENSLRALDAGELNGEPSTWPKGRMELELKPGMNDVGKISFKAEKFKATIQAKDSP